MHLDHQTVGAHSGGGHGQGLHHPVHPGGVGGVHHDGQVAHAADGGNGGQVQGVAGEGLEGTHPSLAQNHVFIASGHDVLRRHNPLLVGVGQAPLEQNGLGHLAHLFEQVEVLHVPGANLHHVHLFLEELAVFGAHQLGDDGKLGLCLGFQQQIQAGGAHALEGVGGGAGLESAAPQQGGPGGLHRLGHVNDLLPALHRAGPGDDGESTAADDGVANAHGAVLGVELPVGLLVWLLDPHHPVHILVDGEFVLVNLGGVSHQAQNGAAHALGDAHPHFRVVCLQLVGQSLDGILCGRGLHHDNHTLFILSTCLSGWEEVPGMQKRPLTANASMSVPFRYVSSCPHGCGCQTPHSYATLLHDKFAVPGKSSKAIISHEVVGRQTGHCCKPRFIQVRPL